MRLATYAAISNRPNIDSYSESHKKFAPNYFKYWFVVEAQRHLYLNNKRLFERWPRESEWASARVIGWCCQSCLLLKSWRNPRTDLGRKWRGRQVTQKTSNLWNLGLWKLSLTDEGRIFCWNLKCTVVCQRFFLPWLNLKIFLGFFIYFWFWVLQVHGMPDQACWCSLVWKLEETCYSRTAKR